MKAMKYIAAWLCLLAMLIGMMTLVSCGTGNGGDGTTGVSEGETTAGAPTEGNTTGKPAEGNTTGKPTEDITTGKPTIPTTPDDGDTTGQYSKAPVMLSFGDKGNAGYFSASSDQYGHYAYDKSKDAVKLAYGAGYVTSADGGCYLFMPKFAKGREKLTDEHRFVRVYLSVKHPDGVETANYVIQNNATGKLIRFDDLANTNGFALTPVAVDANSDILSRMKNGMHCSNAIFANAEGGEYYVRALFFFDNMQDARLFTATDAENLLDARTEQRVEAHPSVIMGFGANGTATPLEGADETGRWTYDNEKLAVKLDYTNAASSELYQAGYGYYFVPKFNQTGMVHNGVGDVSKKDGYLRVLYSVKNPTGVGSVDMSLIESVTENKMITWSGLTNTNGFALTDATEFPGSLALIGRFMRCENNTFAFKTTAEGGEYYIKAVFFFKSASEAVALTLDQAEKLVAEMSNGTSAAPTSAALTDSANSSLVALNGLTGTNRTPLAATLNCTNAGDDMGRANKATFNGSRNGSYDRKARAYSHRL